MSSDDRNVTDPPDKHVAVPDRLSSLKRHLPRDMKAWGRGAVRRYAVATASQRTLPTFLILGAKRGGTTSLWRWLQQHPEVLAMFPAVQQIKSPHYFDINYARGDLWYRSHFPTRRVCDRAAARFGHAPAVGEASPYYLFHPLAPERVARSTPDARLIVTLRDPVERAFSNFRERRGSDAEPLTEFAAALDAEEARLAGEEERILADPTYYSPHHDNHSYLARGRYDEQLRAWWEHVDRGRMLVLQAEAMYRDPEATFRRVEDFLGIGHSDAIEFQHHHKLPSQPWSEPVRERLIAYYEPYNEALYATLGERYDWVSPR